MEEDKRAGVYNDIEPSVLYAEVPTNSEELPVSLSNLNWYGKIKNGVVKLFKIIFRKNSSDIQKGVNE